MYIRGFRLALSGQQGHRLNNTAEGCHQRQLRRAPHPAFQPVDPICRGGLAASLLM